MDAGRRFRAVLSGAPDDCRALVNWGNALCLRARLLESEGGEQAAEDARALYGAAVEKYDAAIAAEPTELGALTSKGLALQDLALAVSQSGDTDEAATILKESNECMEQALASDPTDEAARTGLERGRRLARDGRSQGA